MKKVSFGLIIGLVIGLLSISYAADVTQFIAEKAGFPIMVNGKAFTSDKPAVVINGSTYLPLRAMGEVLNVKVAWNEQLRQVEVGETQAIAELSAKDYFDKLKSTGLPMDNEIVYTVETDPNKLLGRPNQYTSKVNFADKTIAPDGGSIEVFTNNTEVKSRKAYIDEIGKSMPLLVEYSYINGNALLRLNKSLTPAQAELYKTEFMKIK